MSAEGARKPSDSRPKPVRAAHGSFAGLVGEHLIAGLPVVLLLTAFTVLIHAWPPAQRLEGALLRQVMAVREEPPLPWTAEVAWPGPRQPDRETDLPVHVMEVTTEAKLLELEQSGSVPEHTLRRVGGVRPIDRTKFADLLTRIHDRLPASSPSLPVIGIDVDIAPVEGEPPNESMLNALTELRKRAHVVAIVLERKAESDRLTRNTFMKEAKCTRSQGKPANPHEGGLYFASPLLFMRAGGYPIHFPYKHGRSFGSSLDEPTVYPSLGTLMLLRAEDSKSDALTALCEQAFQQGTLTEDDIARHQRQAVPGIGPVDAYKMELFNWTLLQTRWIQPTLIDSLDAVGPCTRKACSRANRPTSPERPPELTRLPDDWFKARMLVIAVDGGPGHDKYDTATPGVTASGAQLHALQAVSLQANLQKGDDSLAALLDIVFGLTFVGIWGASLVLLQPLRQSMPTIARWTATLAAPAIAVLLGWLALRFSAATVGWGWWFNPLFVLLGLLAHAYLEGWSAHDVHAHADRAGWLRRIGRALSFGLSDVLRAGRSGLGMTFTSSMASLHSLHSDLEVRVDKVRTGIGVPGYSDLLVAALLRWALVVAGLVALILH